MKLLKKALVCAIILAFNVTSLKAAKLYPIETKITQSENLFQNFMLDIRTIRKYLEIVQIQIPNKFEQNLINSVINPNPFRPRKEMQPQAFKTSKQPSKLMKRNSIFQNFSNPGVEHCSQAFKNPNHSVDYKKYRIFLKKLLKIHGIFDDITLENNSLSDLIQIDRFYSSRDLLIATKNGSPYNYSYIHKIFSLPIEDYYSMNSVSNLKKLILSLYKDYGILTICLTHKVVHLKYIDDDLEICKIETDKGEELWSFNTLEHSCREYGTLAVYYMEKLKK